MRKVVPKRNIDKKTAAGLIRFYAYEADITRQQLAEALGISRGYFNMILTYNKKKLRPYMIDVIGKELALTEEQTKQIHHFAALEQGYRIGPYVKA